jgi:hypothetical protein
MVLSLELVGRFVAQRGVQVMSIVVSDPVPKYPDEREAAGPFPQPEAFLFESPLTRSVSALPFGLWSLVNAW